MAGELVSLVLKPSEGLPGLEEFSTYLATEFWRQVPGFKMLQARADWGDCTLDLLGRDGSGRLIAVVVRVSRDDRAFHDVIASALIAATWVEENRAETARLYGDSGLDLNHPPRMVFVAPAPLSVSRVLARAADKAGVEVLTYTIYELETSGGPVRAVSFAPPSTPAQPATTPSQSPSTGEVEAVAHHEKPKPARAPVMEQVAVAERPASEDAVELPKPDVPKLETPKLAPVKPEPQPKAEVKPRSPVELFVSSLSDPNLKTMSEQILTFLVSRFPAAVGNVISADRFALHASGGHLATIHLEKSGAVWLEVGPERIPTNKIRDPATLERALNLPSVLMAFDSVRAA